MKEIKQAVILAGGKGERLKPFTDTKPKPLYPINDTPYLEYLIKQIKSFGINKILILVGYLKDEIINTIGNGDKYGVEITYSCDDVEVNTGGRILNAKNLIDDEFLLMYCDNYCPINYNRLIDDYEKNQTLIELSVYPNREGYTKSNIKIDENNKVIKYGKDPEDKNMSGVEIGYMIVNKKVIDLIENKDTNFSSLFPKLIGTNEIYATMCEHRYYSIGSYERMHLTEEFFKNKKAVFLDRDGTINQKMPKACYVEKIDDFKWLNGAKNAIKLLNDKDIIVILVTNQPGIARGNLTEEDLNKIHSKMQDDLKEIGAHIDYIYYCKHNWNEGCLCRKPNPGMLFEAQRDLSLNMNNCHLFGDDERDIEAANKANCNSTLITKEYQLLDAVKDYLKKENK